MKYQTHVDPFSQISGQYDREFSDHLETKRIRERVQQLALKYFAKHSRVLELNCGTGIDAQFLNHHHFSVLASDRSLSMLRVAQHNALSGEHSIQWVLLPIERLDAIKSQSVDAIFSNFGGLNCVENIEEVLDQCYHIVRENGRMILCFINKYSLWEMGAFLFRGKVRQAFRRWSHSQIAVPIGQEHVFVWYHSLGRLKKAMKNKFTILRIIGTNIITPLPASHRFSHRHPTLVKWLSFMERRIDSLPLISSFGDHIIFVLERFE